jgi:hypothetical protein
MVFRADLIGVVKALLANVDLLQRLNILKPGCLLEITGEILGSDDCVEVLHELAEVNSFLEQPRSKSGSKMLGPHFAEGGGLYHSASYDPTLTTAIGR